MFQLAIPKSEPQSRKNNSIMAVSDLWHSLAVEVVRLNCAPLAIGKDETLDLRVEQEAEEAGGLYILLMILR